jgi:hypothetical protein
VKGRSPEFIAVPLVAGILGVLFLVFLAAVFGLAAWLALGLALLVAIAAVLFAVGGSRRAASRDPIRLVAVDDGVYRVLVVADGGCSSTELGAELARHAAGRPTEALVVAPAIGSRLAGWTGDESSYDAAREHLSETLAALHTLGVPATGHVGALDPLQAADDGLRQFAADEVLFAVASEGTPDGLEHDLVERARRRLPVRVEQLSVERH